MVVSDGESNAAETVSREIHSRSASSSVGKRSSTAHSFGRKGARVSSDSKKSASAFKTISEVSQILGVQQHVLRFWETKFSHIRPLKRGGGRRYYRPEDIELLQGIHFLLYTEGYTIKGVQNLIKKNGKSVLLSVEERVSVSSSAQEPRPLLAASPQRSAGSGIGAAAQNSAVERESQSQPEISRGLNRVQKQALGDILSDLKAMREMLNPSEH